MARVRRNWRPAFLAAFAECGNITAAAKAVKVGRRTVYDAKNDPEFARQFADAELEAIDNLEDEAWRRAVTGVDEPVFYKGEECGYVRRYSDTLLIVLLKARAPEKYRENAKVEHSGPGGGAIPITEVIVRRPAPTDADEGEQWEEVSM